MTVIATAGHTIGIAVNTIGLLCALSGLMCGQDLSMELKNNPKGLALFTAAHGQIQIHPFDGPEVSFCASDRSLPPYVSQDGKTILWRGKDSFGVQTVGSPIIQHHSADSTVLWLASVPNHPEAIAYAVATTPPLSTKVIFESTPETAKLLGWPDPHFERQQSYVWTTPSWSPDGKQLALALLDTGSTAGNSGTYVLLWNVISDKSRRIAPGTTPAWSPDGQWISYLRSHGPEHQLAGEARLYNLATGKDEKLFEFDNLDVSLPLRWSPDGKYLLFGRIVHETGNTEDVIWIYRLRDGATTEAFQVQRERVVTRGPDWLSDSQALERTPGPLLTSCEK